MEKATGIVDAGNLGNSPHEDFSRGPIPKEMPESIENSAHRLKKAGDPTPSTTGAPMTCFGHLTINPRSATMSSGGFIFDAKEEADGPPHTAPKFPQPVNQPLPGVNARLATPLVQEEVVTSG